MKGNPSRPQGTVPMRDHYDFSKGVRGKYAKRFASGTNIVLLEPDVADAFPTAKAVNTALRKVLRTAPPRPRRTSKPRKA
jgi:hypothetical protein